MNATKRLISSLLERFFVQSARVFTIALAKAVNVSEFFVRTKKLGAFVALDSSRRFANSQRWTRCRYVLELVTWTHDGLRIEPISFFAFVWN